MALDTAKATAAIRDLTAKFDIAAKSANPFYPTISTIVNSTKAQEKYGWLGTMPGVREWLGERKFKELRGATYELENKHWESSLLIRKTDIADQQMMFYGSEVQRLAQKASLHPDNLMTTVIENGESSASFDGQFFFDTDHAWGESGSQSNDLSHTVSSTTAVTVAEFKAAYQKAVAALLGFKDDQGEPLSTIGINQMTQLVLMVPLALRQVAYESINSQIISNSTNITIDRPTIVCNPYLSSSVKFYVFDTSSPLKPFVFQAREPLKRGTKGLDDIEVKHVKFMTEGRYNMGYLAWWTAALVTLTT